MRARDFLLEYNRQITAQRYGAKVLQRVAQDRRVSNQLIAELTPEQRTRLIDNILSQLEAADPTPNKQYMPWIVKMYSERGYGSDIEDMASTTRDALAKFHALKSRRRLFQHVSADIMQYKTVSYFLDVVDALPDPEELDEPENRGQAQEVYQDADVRVIVPEDEAAACYYGRGTRWCTAARSNNYFEHYHRQGPLYVLIPKAARYPGEKYQVHWPSGQFMDERDNETEPLWLLTQRFPRLLEWFRAEVPDVQRWMMFTPDDVMEGLIRQIRQDVMRQAQEIVAELEVNDEIYYDELIRAGLVYPEGHPEAGSIDWDRVEDEGATYQDFYPQFFQFLRELDDALGVSPDVILGLAVDEYGADVETSYLTETMSRRISEAFRGRRDVEWLVNRVTDYIDVNLDVRDLAGDGGQRGFPKWTLTRLGPANAQGKRTWVPVDNQRGPQ